MGQSSSTASTPAPGSSTPQLIATASPQSTVPSRVADTNQIWDSIQSKDKNINMPSSMPRFPNIEQEADEIDFIYHSQPTFTEKLWSKCKQDPFIPIGMVATGGMLAGGLYSMGLNNSQMSQRFMRYRVACQGLTVVAVGWALYRIGTNQVAENRKEVQQLQK